MPRPKKVIADEVPKAGEPETTPEVAPAKKEEFDPGIPESKQRHLR